MIRTLTRAPAPPVTGSPTGMGLPRRFARGMFFWVFGLSASILIGSMWGSTAAGNRDTVAGAIHAAAAEQMVQERIVRWVAEGLESVGLMATGDSGIGEELLAEPEIQEVLARLTDQVVEAAFAPAGTTASVDPAAALLPSVPELTRLLADEGIVADASTVTALVASIEPVLLDDGGVLPLTGAATRVSSALSLAAVLAGLMMIIAGAGAALLSVDRLGAVRNLAYRLMLTSLSFTVLLALGSWLADPAGGASPWRSGLSSVLASHLHVPLLLAGAAGLLGGVTFWVAKRRSGLRSGFAPTGI